MCSSKFMVWRVKYINSNKNHMLRPAVHKILIIEPLNKGITWRYKQNTHHKYWSMTNAWLYLQGNLDVAPSPTIQKRESFFHEMLVSFPSLTQNNNHLFTYWHIIWSVSVKWPHTINPTFQNNYHVIIKNICVVTQ